VGERAKKALKRGILLSQGGNGESLLINGVSGEQRKGIPVGKKRPYSFRTEHGMV